VHSSQECAVGAQGRRQRNGVVAIRVLATASVESGGGLMRSVIEGDSVSIGESRLNDLPAVVKVCRKRRLPRQGVDVFAQKSASYSIARV
jgi:hypothetical protein